jgi:hypothetical protein
MNIYQSLFSLDTTEKLTFIQVQSQDIETLMNIDATKKQLEQYELYNQKTLIKETYFNDGSYLITKFHPHQAQAIESRLYEPLSDHFINTKLIQHNIDNSNDLHELDLETLEIKSQKFRPLINLADIFIQVPTHESMPQFTLNTKTLNINVKTKSINILENDTSLLNDKDNNIIHTPILSAQERSEKLIEKAREFHRKGCEIDIVPINQ